MSGGISNHGGNRLDRVGLMLYLLLYSPVAARNGREPADVPVETMTGPSERGDGADRLLIGQVAERAGVNVQTLRYYERRGLLEEPKRSASGYRLYPSDTVGLIRFVKRTQELGFSLDEVERLLDLRNTAGSSCEEVQELAEGQVRQIDGKIRDLTALRSALQTLIRSCERGDPDRECPIIETLDREARGPGSSGA